MSRLTPLGLGALLLALALGATGAACTDTELRCISADCQDKVLAVVDNVVQAQGKVCTRDPNTATYPYKVLLVIDTSESTVYSDPDAVNGRYNALLKVLNDPNYKNNPNVQFAIMSFATYATAEQAEFTSDYATLISAIAPLNAAHSRGPQGQTDYLEALKLATQIITDDATKTNPSARAYTQYDVQWLSDGNPEVNPDCSQGCGANDPTLLQHCVETIPEVVARTQDFLNLKNSLGVFAIKFSAIFLSDAYPSPCTPLFDGIKWAAGDTYLKAMVALNAGQGTFTPVDDASKLEFHINVQTITRRFEQNSFFLINYSRVVEGNQILPDSDQDGISDAAEQVAGLDPTKGHSLATTMCSDLGRYRSSDNPNLCIQACMPGAQSSLAGLAPLADQDGEGLLNCEESVLLSNAQLIDSDFDNLTDDIETRFNTSPISFTDNRLDNDRDGIYDYDEIILGLNPTSPQPDRSLAYDYVPLQTATGDAIPGVSCYTFQVNNVRLAATEASEVSKKGDNNICLLLVQHPVNDPNGQPTISRACKTANYQLDPNGLGIKAPADGLLNFAASDFQVVLCADGKCAAGDGGSPSSAPASNTGQPTTGQKDLSRAAGQLPGTARASDAAALPSGGRED